MLDRSQAQEKIANLENKRMQYSKAIENFNLMQEKVAESSLAVHEKVALYSAGIISLSLTFVGTFIDKYGIILNSPIWHLQLKHVLFISWGLLLVSFVLSLFSGWFHARHRFWGGGFELARDQADFYTAQKDYIDSGLPTISSDGLSTEQQSADAGKSAKKSKDIEYKSKRLADRYLSIFRAFDGVGICSFGVGVVALTVFAILAINGAVWIYTWSDSQSPDPACFKILSWDKTSH